METMTPQLPVILQALSALFAICAAILWFKSAVVQTPSTFRISVAKPSGAWGEPLGGNPLGAEYIANGYSPDLQDLAKALVKQSRWNARGAVCAAIAALIQAAALFS